MKSKNSQLLKMIDLIFEHTGDRGIHAIDRGGDRGVLYKKYLGEKKPRRFVIRLVGRDLVHQGSWRNCCDLAKVLPTPYETVLIVYEEWKEKKKTIHYNTVAVKLPSYNHKLYLVVVKWFGMQPIMLLTSCSVKKISEREYREDCGILFGPLEMRLIPSLYQAVLSAWGCEGLKLYQYLEHRGSCVSRILFCSELSGAKYETYDGCRKILHCFEKILWSTNLFLTAQFLKESSICSTKIIRHSRGLNQTTLMIFSYVLATDKQLRKLRKILPEIFYLTFDFSLCKTLSTI